jgi:hypothetical protein
MTSVNYINLLILDMIIIDINNEMSNGYKQKNMR